MSNNNIFINKLLKNNIQSSDRKCFIYTQSKWEEGQVVVLLQDAETGKCFRGLLSTQAMEAAASELDLPFAEFYEECRAALTTNFSLPGYIYKLEAEKSIFQIVKKQNFEIVYLEIPLKESHNHYEILDAAIELLGKRKETIQSKDMADAYDERLKDLLQDYRCCVEEKNDLEKKLLKKFAVLLNTKKQKIAELQERLQQYENDEKIACEEKEEETRWNEVSEVEETHPSGNTFSGKHSRRWQRPLTIQDDDSDDAGSEADYLAETQPMTPPVERPCSTTETMRRKRLKSDTASRNQTSEDSDN